MVRSLLTFGHTPVYFRSVIVKGFSMARAATLPQREGATSLLWDCSSANHSPKIPDMLHEMPEHRNPDLGVRRLPECDWIGMAGRGREGKVSPRKLGLQGCELRDKTAGLLE